MSQRKLAWGAAWILASLVGLAATWAEAPKVGDKVEIKFGDTWIDATVTWVDGTRVRARSSNGLESWFNAGEFRSAGKTETTPGNKTPEKPADKPGPAVPDVQPGGVKTPSLPRAGETIEVSFAGTWLEAKVLKLEGPRVQAKLRSGMEKWFETGEYRVIPKIDPKFYANLAPGSRVEANDGNRWYPATVKKREAARFFIHYDNFSDAWDAWLKPDKIRPRPDPSGQVAAGSAPGSAETGTAPNVITTASGTVALGDLTSVREVMAEDEVDWAVKPQAPPVAPAIGAGPYTLGTGFREGEKLGRMQFIGADALITFVHEDPFGPLKSRVVRVSLNSQHTPASITIAPGKRLMDVSPDGELALYLAKISDVPNCLEVGALAPAKAARDIIWKPHSSKDNEGTLTMAAFVDRSHVISCDSEGELVLWELPGSDKPATTQATTAPSRPKGIYRMKVSTSIRPQLMPGQTTLMAEAKSKLRFFNALTGSGLGSIANLPLVTADVSFNAAGSLLAVTTPQRMFIVNLVSGHVAREVPIPPEFVKKSSTATTWLPSGHLLLGNRYMVSPSQRLVVWAYLFPRRTVIDTYAGTTWFIAGEDGPLSLCSAKIPHEQAKAAAPAVKIEDLLVFRKGEPVTLDITTDAPGDQRDKIQASLEKQVKAMGLTVGNGPVHIVASTTSGDTKTQEYRVFGRGVESVSITEKIHTLAVQLDGKELWKLTSRSGISFMIAAKQGQSLQDAAIEQQNRSYAWLGTATIPRDLVRPDSYKVAGASHVSGSGIASASDADLEAAEATPVEPTRGGGRVRPRR